MSKSIGDRDRATAEKIARDRYSALLHKIENESIQAVNRLTNGVAGKFGVEEAQKKVSIAHSVLREAEREVEIIKAKAYASVQDERNKIDTSAQAMKDAAREMFDTAIKKIYEESLPEPLKTAVYGIASTKDFSTAVLEKVQPKLKQGGADVAR